MKPKFIPLYSACKQGDLDQVILLLNTLAVPSPGLSSLLRLACKHGHTELVKKLVRLGANIHTRDDYLLRTAIKRGRIEIVKFLIDSGANVDALNGSPFRNAMNLQPTIYDYNSEPVKNVQEHIDKTHAITNCMILHLLNAGASPTDYKVLFRKRNYQGILLIEKYIKKVDQESRDYYMGKEIQPLSYLGNNINKERVNIVAELLKIGANPNGYYQKEPILCWACSSGNLEIVKLLISAGANVQEKDNISLQKAAMHGYTEIVKLLLKHGANKFANDGYAIKAASKRADTETRLALCPLSDYELGLEP